MDDRDATCDARSPKGFALRCWTVAWKASRSSRLFLSAKASAERVRTRPSLRLVSCAFYDRRAVTAGALPRILVVEDDRETRQFYSEALGRGGFQVEQAHNGHQALEKALSSPPDVILTDIAVPGLDGIELCQRLRADSRTRKIPVLAITGYDDRQYPSRATMAGADQVLTKPCEAEVIVGEARRLLELRD